MISYRKPLTIKDIKILDKTNLHCQNNDQVSPQSGELSQELLAHCHLDQCTCRNKGLHICMCNIMHLQKVRSNLNEVQLCFTYKTLFPPYLLYTTLYPVHSTKLHNFGPRLRITPLSSRITLTTHKHMNNYAHFCCSRYTNFCFNLLRKLLKYTSLKELIVIFAQQHI